MRGFSSARLLLVYGLDRSLGPILDKDGGADDAGADPADDPSDDGLNASDITSNVKAQYALVKEHKHEKNDEDVEVGFLIHGITP